MKLGLLTEALGTARRKLFKHPEFRHFPHYTFIVQNNRIVEWATNSRGSPPIHYGYHRRHGGQPKIHSEVNAYRRVRGLLLPEPFEAINIRLNRSGLVRLSRPCICCHNFLKAQGCVEVWYSTEEGWLFL